MRWEWKNAVHKGSISELHHLLVAGYDAEWGARDQHGQRALMSCRGQRSRSRGDVAGRTWCSTGYYGRVGLSALMLAVVRGHVDVVQRLAAAGASLNLRGTGPPDFPARQLSISRLREAKRQTWPIFSQSAADK